MYSRHLLRLLTLALLTALLTAAEAGAQKTSDRITILSDYHGYFPCMDCHGDQESVPTQRILEEEHEVPLAWTDDDGVEHLVPFGRRVALADLLGTTGKDDIAGLALARIGVRLRIGAYMEANDLAPTDSVWTLVHGGGNLWCMDCHDDDDRDKLRRINGELLTFNQSHLLCGGCHGPILRDWDLGIHGTSTGYWDLEQDDEELTVRKLCVECHTPHDPVFQRLHPLAGPVARVPGPGADEHRSEASH